MVGVMKYEQRWNKGKEREQTEEKRGEKIFKSENKALLIHALHALLFASWRLLFSSCLPVDFISPYFLLCSSVDWMKTLLSI